MKKTSCIFCILILMLTIKTNPMKKLKLTIEEIKKQIKTVQKKHKRNNIIKKNKKLSKIQKDIRDYQKKCKKHNITVDLNKEIGKKQYVFSKKQTVAQVKNFLKKTYPIDFSKKTSKVTLLKNLKHFKKMRIFLLKNLLFEDLSTTIINSTKASVEKNNLEKSITIRSKLLLNNYIFYDVNRYKKYMSQKFITLQVKEDLLNEREKYSATIRNMSFGIKKNKI
ncbi:hypothetical protein ACFLYU_00700 [Candidatus Dependentiae bacterium]